VNLAWFAPAPATHSGIAAYSAEILPLVAARGWVIDVYTAANAVDFVWTTRRTPYALVVYQLGNASCHDFMWGYLFRYPGVVVLHDAQLHQARALALTRRWMPRRDDYLAEFRANHPDAPPDVGEIVAAGFGQPSLYAMWPHIKLIIDSARLTMVHNARLADDLRREFPTALIDRVPMGVADPRAAGSPHDAARRRHTVLHRHGLPEDALVLAAFGGMTPEKRIPALLRAVSALRERHPQLHLMLVGAPADYYDVPAEAERWGIRDRVHVTGYVSDAELPAYLLAADICACLRWPTNRETSASLLRAMAAGRPVLVSDLADLVDLPTIDPRGWVTRDATWPNRTPVAISIDLVDEDHSLQLALEWLAVAADRRARLGAAARDWWAAHHQLDAMAEAYDRALRRALDAPIRRVALPAHLIADRTDHARQLAAALGVAGRVAGVLGEGRITERESGAMRDS
jgi:glycosyltransferase involved in cell wall biosynthesis